MAWKIYSGSRADATYSKGTGYFFKSNQVPFQLLREIELGKVKAKRNKRKCAGSSGRATMGRGREAMEGWSLPPTT